MGIIRTVEMSADLRIALRDLWKSARATEQAVSQILDEVAAVRDCDAMMSGDVEDIALSIDLATVRLQALEEALSGLRSTFELEPDA